MTVDYLLANLGAVLFSAPQSNRSILDYAYARTGDTIYVMSPDTARIGLDAHSVARLVSEEVAQLAPPGSEAWANVFIVYLLGLLTARERPSLLLLPREMGIETQATYSRLEKFERVLLVRPNGKIVGQQSNAELVSREVRALVGLHCGSKEISGFAKYYGLPKCGVLFNVAGTGEKGIEHLLPSDAACLELNLASGSRRSWVWGIR